MSDQPRTQDEFHLLTVLRKLEIFRSLDVEQGKHVLRLCERISWNPGDVVWRAGDDSDTIIVLLTGSMAIEDARGRQTGTAGPGQSYGEMGVLTGHKRFVTLHALETSTALCLRRWHLRNLVGERQAIYVKILETAVDILSHRLTESQHEH